MKRFTFLVLGILITALPLEAQTTIDNGTEVSGTWTIVNSPYLIEGIAIVPPGDTLIIDPGVEIKFNTGDDYSFYSDNSVDVGLLYIKGNLIAEGTSTQRIIFTRQGDSGNWGCIAFSETADTSSSFNYCKVEHANRIEYLETKNYDGALSFINPKVSISHSEIIANNYHGIYGNHTTFFIKNCIIANNSLRGIYSGYPFNSSDTIIIANNTIVGNGSTGFRANIAKCKIVNNIFWDNSESIYLQFNTCIASYNLVQEDVLVESSLIIGEGMIYNFDPQLGPDFYPQYNSPAINAGTQDTSGLTLSDYDFLGNNRINQSRIDIGAVESDNLKLICLLAPNGMEGFLSGTNQTISWKSNVENLKLEYTYDNGGNWAEISESTPNDGLYNWIVPPVESESFNIRISDVTDNSVFDVCDDNFTVFTSNIPDSTILTGRLTIDNSPYYINGLAIVPPEDTLIIDPGVELRFKTGIDFSYFNDNTVDVGLLYVKGNLIAEGTSSQRITFTRQGDSGYWGCIAFSATADTSSSFKFCKVEYANRIEYLESKYYSGALSFRNPKVSITHSEITANNCDGIKGDYTNPLIQNCLIANNNQSGIYLYYAFNNSDTIIIANNTIVGNGSTGIRDISARCKIVNNILWNNNESFYIDYFTSIASYNLVQENVIIESSLIIGEGMIYNSNPQLGPDSQPQYNSPVINAGTQDTSGLYLSGYDFLGNNRINQSRIDIGAVESDALKLICLLSPNGQEGFLPGTNQAISWKSNVENLKLEYTYDNGSNWVEITGSTPNDGLYNWIVPPVESESFNIRISDVTDNSFFDECDDNFAVFTSNIPDSIFLTGRLTLEHSPYYINGLVIVPFGDSLIIDPGVEIRFKTGNDYSYLSDNSVDVGLLFIKGKLIAEGTSSQRITFTRQGDSGYWGCIAFSEIAERASLRYCKVEYANRIENLEATNYDGALAFTNPGASITHTEITTNNYHGIDSDDSTPLIQNCIIANNELDGIHIDSPFNNSDTIIITNNTITGNGSSGIYDSYAKCKIVNNILWNNKESYYKNSYTSLLSYNLVQEDIITESPVVIGEGMIYNLDPQFINSGNNDYHLKVTSPCIDAGDPGSIYTMEPVENGGRINLGVYGNTDEATITENLPRINYLSSNSGGMFGKDTVTIKGTQFLSNRGSGKVIFDSTETTEYLYWSDDSIICITPPHLNGIVDINIINNADKKGFGISCFSFLPPVLNKPDPIFSNTSGGEHIIFSGELFGHSQNGIQVLFDQNEAPLYHTWKDDTIILNCPSHSEGLVDIIFKLNDSIYYNFNESFLYSDALTELCGEISDTLFNSQTYLLTCPVTIPEGQTLIIEPGVLIIAQYDEDNLISILSDGVIKAIGTESDPIKIISFPQYKGAWEGIILKNQGIFDYCVIKNGINGISVEKGNLELKNSTIRNNLNAGLDFKGDETYITINVENTDMLDNKYGIYARASNGYVSATLSSCNILDNDEFGIDLYSRGFASGFIVPISVSSRINFTLKNSVVSRSGSNAIKIRSYGFSSSSYSPTVYRYGLVNFISENSIIFNNGNGIIARRESKSYCTVNTEFYNTVMYNNNSVIEMDATKVFMYNSNLWDNGISGNPVGICDSLVVENSDLNSLDNIPNGSNNISSDPMYISPLSGDFHLSQGSLCIDAGLNEFVYFETDFDSKVRIWNATDKDSAIVDIGAFEYDAPCYAIATEINICAGESYEGYTESGTYHFNYVNDSGCDSVIIVNLHVHPVPEMPIIIQDMDTLISNVASGNQWYLNNSAIEGATNQQYVIAENGDYHVVVTNEFGCTSSPSNIIDVIYTSLGGLKLNGLKIYPNPATDIITIEGLSGYNEVEIAIYDLKGNLVIKIITSSTEAHINIRDIKPATYILVINNQVRQVIKIIKK